MNGYNWSWKSPASEHLFLVLMFLTTLLAYHHIPVTRLAPAHTYSTTHTHTHERFKRDKKTNLHLCCALWNGLERHEDDTTILCSSASSLHMVLLPRNSRWIFVLRIALCLFRYEHWRDGRKHSLWYTRCLVLWKQWISKQQNVPQGRQGNTTSNLWYHWWRIDRRKWHLLLT